MYMLVENRSRPKYFPPFSVASFVRVFAIVGVGLNLMYNYSIFCNQFEFPQLMSGTGIHFLVNTSLFEHILFYLISPFRGVFVLCPILILGLFGFREMWGLYRRESILFITLFTVILVYYSAWQGWDGACAYGPRFMVIGLPYLAISITILLTQKREWFKTFLGLFFISSFIEGIGAIAGPSAPGRNDPLLFQPVSFALPQILSGNVSVFWIQWIGYPAVVAETLLVFSIIWYVVNKIIFDHYFESGKVP
jgi:hypothetical protein